MARRPESSRQWDVRRKQCKGVVRDSDTSGDLAHGQQPGLAFVLSRRSS
jgi:hypothetical protein